MIQSHFPFSDESIRIAGTALQSTGQFRQQAGFLVDSTVQNYIHNNSFVQEVKAHGLAVPGVIQELQTASIQLHSEQIQSLASSLSVVTLPAYNTGQIMTYGNASISCGIEFLWCGDGTSYIDNKGYIATNHSPGVQYVAASTGRFEVVPIDGFMADATNAMFFQEVATLTQYISYERRELYGNPDFRIGAIIKMIGGVYFWCRPSVANPKHRGDFQLFLASAIYRLPVFTQDSDLKRDLSENSLRIIHFDRRTCA
jgi:hypothetical protein